MHINSSYLKITVPILMVGEYLVEHFHAFIALLIKT